MRLDQRRDRILFAAAALTTMASCSTTPFDPTALPDAGTDLGVALMADTAAPGDTGLTSDAGLAGDTAVPIDAVAPNPTTADPACALPRCFATFFAATAECHPDFTGGCNGDVKAPTPGTDELFSAPTCWSTGVKARTTYTRKDGLVNTDGLTTRPDGSPCFTWSGAQAGEILGKAIFQLTYRDALGVVVGTSTERNDGSTLYTCPDESKILPASCSSPLELPACAPGTCTL